MFIIIIQTELNTASTLESTAEWTLRRMFVTTLNKMVLVKTNHINSAEKKAKQRYEYEMLSQLSNKWLLQPIAIERLEKQDAIFYEDFNGITLKQYMQQNLSMHHFVTIAIEMANACLSLHQQNIVYKNLGPHNILVHPTSLQVKLLSSEYMTKLNNNTPSTTENVYDGLEHIAYLAPEMTGRLNWKIDHRTDLYALGAIFYEMLSKTKPFQSSLATDLIYEILTKEPRPLHVVTEEVPVILSEIVGKLVSKNPEERYQSTIGLKADLILLQSLMVEGTEELTFLLGQQDISMNVGLTTKLYGRENEFEKLENLFNDTRKGAKNLVFITGKSGVGKSKFILELKHYVLLSKGYFVASKFDQLQEETPFAPMIMPLRDVLKQVYLEGESSVAVWRKLFKEVDLNPTEQLITLIPELNWFIEANIELVSDHSDNTRQLYAYIFSSIQKILVTFAMQGHPIVLFLDDLQWADNLSIEMMQQIYEQHDAGYFIVIGSYRQDEISDGHLINTWQKNVEEHTMISLQLLSEQDVITWFEDSFNSQSAIIESFGRQVHYLTEGNPLFVKEAFLSLQSEKIIYYNLNDKLWEFDVTKVQQVYSNEKLLTVIENRINDLNRDVQDILQLASCFGKQFDINNLLKLVRCSSKELLQALKQLVEGGFLIPLDENYKWAFAFEEEGILQAYALQFQFVHDRIQKVAYMNLSDDERASVHFSIGGILKDSEQSIEEMERLIEIVKHFNYCKHLLNSIEKQDLAIWNYQLGVNAKKSGLFENALFFLTTCLELLPSNHWVEYRELAFEVCAHLGECEYLVGQYHKSESHLNTALDNAQNRLEQLSIYHLKTTLYIESDTITAGIDSGLQGLAVGNMKFATVPSRLKLLREFAFLKFELRSKSNTELLSIPSAQEKEIQLLIQIINNMLASSYRLNPTLSGILMLRAMRLLLKYGGTDESGIVFINYALILNAGFDDIKNAFRYGQLAVTMAEKQNNIYLIARIYFVYGMFINHNSDTYEKNIYYLNKAQQYSNDIGIYYIVAVSSCFICTTQLISGQKLEELKEEVERQRNLTFTKNHTSAHEYLVELDLWIQTLREEITDIPWDHPFTIQDEASDKIMHLMLRLKMSFWLQNYEQAFNILDELKQPMKSAFALVLTPYYYYYRALWQISSIQQKRCTQKQKVEYERDIKQSLKKLRKWSQHAPQNYEHLYTLLRAEYYQIQGLTSEAALHYDRAIQLARVHEFIQDEAIACERAAHFSVTQKDHKLAEDYILRGIQLMKNWGATRVAKQWEEQYAVVIVSSVPVKIDKPISFDLLTVFDTTHSLSQEIRMDELLRKMLFSILKHAGANIGYFIYKTKEGFVALAKAEANVTDFTLYNHKPLNELPESLQFMVRYVQQSGEYVIIDNAQIDTRFIHSTGNEKSILCLPILHKGGVVGALYLENNVTFQAFNAEKVEMLRMLSVQIAISIENAQMYADLEQRVEARTKELATINVHLTEANDRLQKNELERKRLLHSISHDLRTPITSALGYLESILDGVVKDEAKQVLYLQRSKERLLSLNKMIQDLFDLANLGAGRVEFTYSKLSVQQLYEEFSMKYEDEVCQSGLNYSTMMKCKEDAFVLVDMGRINQVIFNLIQNAIKYTNEGLINFVMTVHEKTLICSIEDSGLGIPKNELDFIFDSYFGGSNSANVESNGIGLAICKQIIQQHGGEIWTESVEKEGSKFIFTLPIIG